jgi:Protein of unknown function (DUF3237)
MVSRPSAHQLWADQFVNASVAPLVPLVPVAPALTYLAHIRCDVGDIVSLGTGAALERRCVAINGGQVSGPKLQGEVVPGGVDWQWQGADGVLDISARYLLRLADGALVEVQSTGLRHGSPEAMARLMSGQPVASGEIFFKTHMRFTTGHASWLHLNRTLAVAVATRLPRQVLLDVWQLV